MSTMSKCEEEMADKIEGLEADLEEAVRVAFNRGAYEWTRLNYPGLYKRLLEESDLLPDVARQDRLG